eukprot:PhF_6_TR22732/c0_g1_i7/m.32402/K15423/PPP4C; serine/threonine-protein phosphatase 4 catalytic subunit
MTSSCSYSPDCFLCKILNLGIPSSDEFDVVVDQFMKSSQSPPHGVGAADAEYVPFRNIGAPCVVIGYLKGHVNDLMEWLHRIHYKEGGVTPNTNILILGNFVRNMFVPVREEERGRIHSLHTVYILLQYALWRRQQGYCGEVVFLLGKHEHFISYYWNQEGIEKNSDVAEALTPLCVTWLDTLPFMVTIEDRILCSSMGLHPLLETSLRELQIHTEGKKQELCEWVLMTTFEEGVEGWGCCGRGEFCFGDDYVAKLLAEGNPLEMVILSGRYICEGYMEKLDGKIIQICSHTLRPVCMHRAILMVDDMLTVHPLCY